MSHNHEPIICPNCGFHATDNYCAQCGQETHLHNDSFWGLIMHFIGHYFHYDSKFWSTMKALWFSPGKLTIAYKEKKRMRYIPPVSLYIFISVVFFIAFSLMANYRLGKDVTQKKVGKSMQHIGKTLTAEGDSLERREIRAEIKEADSILAVLRSKGISSKDSIMIRQQLYNIENLKVQDSLLNKIYPKTESDSDHKEKLEKMLHFAPKVFFFMIPIMGLVLLLFFARRKGVNYTDHVIFALHYHTFWFSYMLLLVLLYLPLSFLDFSSGWVALFILSIPALYMVISLRKVYAIGWGRSIFYSFVIGFFYFVLTLVPLVALQFAHQKGFM